MTWQRGRELVTRNRTELEGELRPFVKELQEHDEITRIPGTAVFLHANNETTPLAMRNVVEHNRVLHEAVVIMSIEIARVPHVGDEDRLAIDELGFADDGITHVKATYGFQDDTDVPHALRLCEARGLERPIDVDNASFFLSRMTIIPGRAKGMARWRKRMFVTLARNAADASDYFKLPQDSVVSMGSHVEL
jgi:KUP system potassium uptake protein